MSTCKCILFFVLLSKSIDSVVGSDVVNVTVSDSADKPSSPAANSPLFIDSVFHLSLMSSFPEDQEISQYCSEMLGLFGQRYDACLKCVIPAARPFKVCEKCYSSYDSLAQIYINISSDQTGPSNESCRESLLRSDRLVLLSMLFSSLKEVWKASACEQCIIKDYKGLTNDTLYFLTFFNQTLTCFEKNKEGNHTELCKNCKGTYRGLNELYSLMEKNHTLCMDIEDAMNVTRKLWSKSFNCSFPREETVPVIAVSSFMLFLPIIFYLSNFLHSEQKKRKLIHPKRAKSYTSLMNIQDKQS
ncbi:osteopetrosis-associated transmembrane protein 1 [Cololabis saira]|uniref:osteopetrosis-associated transmembrane protein 1 n=1 Tax=Cololabis saira TaxID=129043 RepID=UPI002AD2385E|nr:osteopetrosis-associated transmembrane protein 1 [Cololabis saira]